MGVRQIAKLAGVSVGAVSMALHDSPSISEETKRRIRKIAKSIDYRPNAKVGEFMSLVRSSSPNRTTESCFGIMSFHPNPRPWECSSHHMGIYRGMTQRAADLGYRLEPLWLRSPGMTHRRFRAILEARGIQGLLCFSSPVEGQTFPAELDNYAIVTVSLTIRTSLCRVTTHFFNDTWTSFEKLRERGYRRPGLVIGVNDDYCSGHACSSAYLGWYRNRLSTDQPVPLLRTDKIEEETFIDWWKAYRPDSIVFMHGLDNSAHELLAILKKHRIEVPRDLGVLAGFQVLDRAGCAGMEMNSQIIGSSAVEMLAARVTNRDFGIPKQPRVEMVEGNWIDGSSLRDLT